MLGLLGSPHACVVLSGLCICICMGEEVVVNHPHQYSCSRIQGSLLAP